MSGGGILTLLMIAGPELNLTGQWSRAPPEGQRLHPQLPRIGTLPVVDESVVMQQASNT